MGELTFDRALWPEGSSVLPTEPPRPYDLNDLWETNPDQAATFVAEALIAEKPHMLIEPLDDVADFRVEAFIWRIGDDTLSIEARLIDELRTTPEVLAHTGNGDLDSREAALDNLLNVVAQELVACQREKAARLARQKEAEELTVQVNGLLSGLPANALAADIKELVEKNLPDGWLWIEDEPLNNSPRVKVLGKAKG